LVLVPELVLIRPDAGKELLQRVFGFRLDGHLLRLGSQALILIEGAPQGHGRIDHVALAVPEMDTAFATLTAAGARLDPAITPNGPESIPEFWDDGIRFVYLGGPESARIELCQRVSGAVTETGHDHIGIPCHDLPAMQRFFEAQGARLIAAVELHRPNGVIPVRFLSYAGGVIELFAPQTPKRAVSGLWSRLRVGGLGQEVAGPEGMILAPL
jgi:catechol 2,3-dioxygenase-like lactoylglutathione lyase family enzyme